MVAGLWLVPTLFPRRWWRTTWTPRGGPSGSLCSPSARETWTNPLKYPQLFLILNSVKPPVTLHSRNVALFKKEKAVFFLICCFPPPPHAHSEKQTMDCFFFLFLFLFFFFFLYAVVALSWRWRKALLTSEANIVRKEGASVGSGQVSFPVCSF